MRLSRLLIGATLTGLLAIAAIRSANATEGPPGDLAIFLREAPGTELGIEVVLRWTALADPAAEYQVWRRTPPDRSFQQNERYATVPASARQADGGFEFVDRGPFDLVNRPCYMVAASVGGAVPTSYAGDVCIPTLPSAMSGLKLTASPGPRRDSWYVSARGFARGASVTVAELVCDEPPCPQGAPLQDATRTTSDGRLSKIIDLPPRPPGGTRILVAYETGWLPSQYEAAPRLTVPASQPGAPLGHPLSTRTGLAEVDRALVALESFDAQAVAALFVPHEVVNPLGARVNGVPAISCDHESVREPALGLEMLAHEAFASRIYAVFRVAPEPGQWQLFDGASYGIVLVDEGGGSTPLATLTTVSSEGIVGVGTRCGTVPPYWIRSAGEFILAPLTVPTGPTAGTGLRSDSRGYSLALFMSGTLLLAAGLIAAAAARAMAKTR